MSVPRSRVGRRHTSPGRRWAVGLAFGTLTLGACGSTDSGSTGAGSSGASSTEAPAARTPAVTTAPPADTTTSVTTSGTTDVATDGTTGATSAVILDVATADTAGAAVPDSLQFSVPLVGGGQLDGAALVGRPVAFWFWAPT